MGLDTSHNAWHGPYSAFSGWRNYIAVAAGYSLKKVPLFTGGPPSNDQPDIDWSQYVESNYAGEWDEMPNDPLLVLFVHSDCDGVIHPEHAMLLAERLKELVPELKNQYLRDKTEMFIGGLYAASSMDEDVDFH